MISNQTYLNWQKKLAENSLFRNFWTFAGIYSVLFYAIFAAYLLTLPNGAKALFSVILVGFFTRYAVSEIIHFFYKKQHPYQRLNFTPPTSRLFCYTDARRDAFVSDHACTSTALSFAFFSFHPIMGILAFAAMVLISLGRIVLGYHDVYDVLAGWIVGILSALLTLYVVGLFW